MDWDPDFLAHSPMFEPLRPLGGALARPDWPARSVLQNLLERGGNPVMTRSGLPLRLVPAGGRMRFFEERYEARIHLRGEMIFRERNWHDLLNVLVWLTFPRAKAALNARHYAALRAQYAAGAANRGPAQDALTLFDEGGVIVASCDDQLLGMLRAFKWKELFWRHRDAVRSRMQFKLFGHALYEKALRPFAGGAEAWSRGRRNAEQGPHACGDATAKPAIGASSMPAPSASQGSDPKGSLFRPSTRPALRGCDGGGAHEPTISPGTRPLPQRQSLLRRPSATGRGILLKTEPALLAQPPCEQLAAIDSQVAAHLSESGNLAAPRELAVVPVLGVPGWCPVNEQESYYDNTDYFRPGRFREVRES